MASLGEELLTSADSHVIEDPHFWEQWLPAAFKDQGKRNKKVAIKLRPRMRIAGHVLLCFVR
jgi:hypothetical protein